MESLGVCETEGWLTCLADDDDDDGDHQQTGLTEGQERMRIKDHPAYFKLTNALIRQRTVLGVTADASAGEAAFEEGVGASIHTSSECALYIEKRVSLIEQSIQQISALLSQLQAGGERVRMRVKEEARALVQLSSSPEQVTGEDSDEEERKHKPMMNRHAQDILTAWLKTHLEHPYPDDDEKDELLARTGITVLQMNNWFVNARRRAIHRLRAEATRRKRLEGKSG
jgi:hypothetical protein